MKSISEETYFLILLKLKKRGSLCRGIQNECDLEEYCAGDSPQVSLYIIYIEREARLEY